MYLGTQAQSGSGRIHGHISAAYNRYLLAGEDGSIVIITEGLHQVASGQILVSGEHAVGILSGDSHELRQSRSGADKYGLKALVLHQLVDGYGLSDDHVGLNLDSKLLYILNLRSHYSGLGQTELGDAVNQHAAGLVKGLENGNLIAHLSQVSGTGQSRRTGTDHRYLMPVGLLRLLRHNAVLSGPVRYEPFQLSDGNCLSLDSSDALALTLALLRAYSSADRGKGAGFCNGLRGFLEFSFFYLLDKLRDIDGNRAALNAAGVLAV